MHRFHALMVCLLAAGCSGVPVDQEVEQTALTEAGGFTGPAWSPDGTRISFSGPGYRGLYEVAADGGVVREILPPGTRTWFRHGWRGGCIVRPVLGDQNALELTPGDGVVRVLAPDPLAGPAVELRRDDLVLVDGGEELWLTHGEDRFFDALISPGGGHVAFVGLHTGVHVIDLYTGRAVAHGGPGTHPTWTPDGAQVVFQRTEDDGYHLIAGDLWILALTDGESRQLTATAAIEQHPAVSPDGTRIAHIRDGAVWVFALGEEVSP